jgi:hypothetical protein
MPAALTCSDGYVATPFVVAPDPPLSVPNVAFNVSGMTTEPPENGLPLSVSVTAAEKFVPSSTVVGGSVLKLRE